MTPGVTESPQNSESNHLPASSKGLFVLVVVMGVMILIGTAALFWVIIHRMMHPHPVTPPEGIAHTVPFSSSLTPATLALPTHHDEQVRSVVARSDGSLAVTLVSPQGESRIVLWLPEQARIVAELDLGAARH